MFDDAHTDSMPDMSDADIRACCNRLLAHFLEFHAYPHTEFFPLIVTENGSK